MQFIYLVVGLTISPQLLHPVIVIEKVNRGISYVVSNLYDPTPLTVIPFLFSFRVIDHTVLLFLPQ